VSRQLWELTITFAIYPEPLFGGALRLLLFTAIPAGFVAYLPARMLRDPSPVTLAASVGAALAYVAFAVWVFDRGVRDTPRAAGSWRSADRKPFALRARLYNVE
jgi:ABC-2 type transport system permease protein